MSSRQAALLAPVRQSFSASIEGKSDEVDDSGSDWAKLVARSAAQKIASKKKIFERFEADLNTAVLSFGMHGFEPKDDCAAIKFNSVE